MTYLQFLLLFLAVPIVLLIVLVKRHVQVLSEQTIWKWITAIASIAFLYTTPWDNYLVFREVWYYGIDRIVATIGYVPIEEYLFFLLQPILTGLFTVLMVSWLDRGSPGRQSSPPRAWRPFLVGFWLLTSLCGVALLLMSANDPRYTYLGLILAWACPVLAGMSWLSSHTFWIYRRSVLAAVAVPTLYLWVADRYAISNGIWDISNTYSLDIDPMGLPLEEAVFFLVTNILVVQGLLMLLPLGQVRDSRDAITA